MEYHTDDNFEPSRVLSGSRPAWLIYVLVIIVILGLGAGLWSALAPESMARLFGRLSSEALQVESLSLSLDRRVVELPPNGTIEIHPAQRFGIVGLNSNRWRNYDLRLYSPEIDVTAVTDGSIATIRELLPNEDFENTREIHITVRDGERDAADFKILSRYSALDFVTRGDAADTPEARAENYRKAYQLDPGSELIRGKLIAALSELSGDKAAQAASIYENLLSQDGPDEEMLIRLADVYEAENKGDRLAAVLTRLIEQVEKRGGQSAPHRQRLANAYARAGRLEEAASIYENLLIGAPLEAKISYLGQLVAIYRQNRDSDREIEALKRLVEIVPPGQSAGIWAEIALLYDKTNDAEGRLSAWRALAEQLPEGEPKANVYKIIGRLLVNEENYPQAKEFYRAALKILPDDVNTLMNLANLAFLENDHSAYIAHLGQIVALRPDDLEYRRKLADSLAAAKQSAKAKEQYLEILKRRPDDQNARLVFIEFLDKIGDKNALLQQYGELFERNRNNKVLPYNMGVIHFERKDWNKAVDSFKKVLEIDPEDLEAREYLLVAYQRKNQRADIIREAMELYRRDPSKTVYRTLMLNTCENAKDWKGFAQVAEEITKVEPASPYGWEQLYKAQKQLGQKEPAAESLWRIAEKTEDKKVDAWFRAAREFAGLGKNDRAGQAYQKILEIEPKNEKAAKALAELNKK